MSEIPFDEALFEKNLALFAERDALAAYWIQLREFNALHFCLTQKGEINLSQQRYGIHDYYHSQEGALEEALNSIKDIDLQQFQVIYFYGIGLGYFYEALLPWLKENPKRHLIFLEDDLEVLAHLLQTEQATTLLQDPQVTLFYFTNLEQDTFRLYQLLSRFINLPTHFFSLPYYNHRYKSKAFALCYQILYDQSWITSLHNEFLSGQAGFINNFYANLLYLPDAYLGSQLFGKFDQVPAIICGAGPSLEKNVGLLKTIKDRAIIFAGGSSLNVLSAHGCLPHFGVGIDPNPEQLHRLMTNDAFHLSLFYRQRMSHTAFQMAQGPKLYVPGSFNKLAEWFEEKLDLHGPNVDEGYNVVNFCTSIATQMGCNPLIYVGMDLAFTTVKTYAQGIGLHPLWLGRSNPYAQENTRVVSRVSINGEKITTKWDWIAEAEWLSQYARKHPSIRMINATEGGLGFYNIPNQSLETVIEKELVQSYDLLGRLHTTVQNSRLDLQRPTIIRLVQEFKSSLEKCQKYCQTILQEEFKWFQQPKKNSTAIYTPKAILYNQLLTEEIGYKYFLDVFAKSNQYLLQSKWMGTRPLQEEQMGSTIQHFQFLNAVTTQHLDLMNRAIQNFIFAPISLLEHNPAPPSAIQTPKNPRFLEYKHEQAAECFTEFYENGRLKQETFYKQRKIEGPSRFYTEAGDLLSEAWFIEDQREGIYRQFYPSTALYSQQFYQNGQWHGRQEFYFENGSPHVMLHYEQGILEGAVTIYNPAGALIRELHYHEGKRHGVEHLWDNQGTLLIECHYQAGVPIQTAREWNSQGGLIREVTIHQFPQDFDVNVWDAKGKCIQSFKHGIEDYSSYLNEKQDQANFIDGAIGLILKRFHSLIQEGQVSNVDEDLMQQLSQLEIDAQHLHTIKEELQSVMEENLKKTEEALRKNQKE